MTIATAATMKAVSMSKNNRNQTLIDTVDWYILAKASQGECEARVTLNVTERQASNIERFYKRRGFDVSYEKDFIGPLTTFQFNWEKGGTT